MDTIDSKRNLIYNTFIAAWGSTTPFALDNEDEASTSLAWVRLVVRNRVGDQDTLGKPTNRKFLRKGAVFIQVFTPRAEGTEEADTLAEKARDIFEGKRFGDLWFIAADVTEQGVEGIWFKMLVEIEFTYEEIK